MSDQLRFCLVGTGRAGLLHARNLAAGRIPGATLSAVCDANESALSTAGDELNVALRFSDYREAVIHPDVDAVIIVTPTFIHAEIAIAAAEAGKHIFLEKPMAIRQAECEAIIDATSRNGVTLQIGFMRRFDESFLAAKERLDSGELGKIMVIESKGRGPGLPPPWIYNLERSNGILAEVNSHDFDSSRWLVGSEIIRVYAEAGNFKCDEARADWPDFYDNAVVTLRFENGTLGTITGTCPCGYGYDARVEILCEKGVLMIGYQQQPGLTEVRLNGEVVGSSVKSWRNLFEPAYQSELKHFTDCVRSGEHPRVSGLDGLAAVRAVVASNASLKSGLPVSLLKEDLS